MGWKNNLLKGKKIKCNICRKKKAKYKDYRYIESCGLQGKVLVCKWCFNLNDVAISQIVRDELNPKSFYNNKNITVNKPAKRSKDDARP